MLFGKNWEFTGADDRDDAMEQYRRQKAIKAKMMPLILEFKIPQAVAIDEL